MKLILIFGPSAVGKMTVGQELSKITGLKLFHNHTSIEWVLQFFDFSEPGFTYLNNLLRFETFQQVAKSDLPGLIFTFVWAFDSPREKAYVDRVVKIFEDVKGEIFYVELEAALETRVARNKHEHRLAHKPSKRNFEKSEAIFWHDQKKYRLNSKEGELKGANYLRIKNDDLSPEEAAKMIVEKFKLLS